MQTDYKMDLIAVTLAGISFLFISIVPNKLMWAITILSSLVISGLATRLWLKRMKKTYFLHSSN